MRRSSILLAAVPAALLLGGTGCFNDAFRGPETNVDGDLDRFELVIEPDRTGVDGTHFLVDRTTGDVWRLELSSRAEGSWVRLASGPTDVTPLILDFDQGDEENPEDY